MSYSTLSLTNATLFTVVVVLSDSLTEIYAPTTLTLLQGSTLTIQYLSPYNTIHFAILDRGSSRSIILTIPRAKTYQGSYTVRGLALDTITIINNDNNPTAIQKPTLTRLSDGSTAIVHRLSNMPTSEHARQTRCTPTVDPYGTVTAQCYEY